MASRFLALLLLSLSLYSTSADVSIDCGSSDSFVDDNHISWTGDNTVINTGQSRSVALGFTSTGDDPLNTLRVFTSGTKNCYTLEGQKGDKVFVRASFYYGNYDGKGSPPTFDIQFDGNEWGTVETTMDAASYIYNEVIYVTKGDSINVCLVQTHANQFPFISALEVRTLDSKMYQYVDSGSAFFAVGRHAFGASQDIRYTDDPYDRIWQASTIVGGLYTSLGYDAISIDTSTSPEKPPEVVLKNAITTLSTSGTSISWKLTELPDYPVPVYLIMYFSEMTQLDTTQTRAFNLYIDNTLMKFSQGAIVPPYGGVTEIYIYNITISSSTVISLQSTSTSTEPPLINAMEVFQVSNFTVSYTAAPSNPPDTSSPSSDNTPSTTPSDNTPSSDNTPTSTSSDGSPSSSKKKSKVPVILGAGIPVFLFVVAFVAVIVMFHQKKQRAMMAAAAAGGGNNNGQQGAVYHNAQNQMMTEAAKLGQEVLMNEFQVNVGDGGDQQMADRGVDPEQQTPYASPTPLLNQNNRYN